MGGGSRGGGGGAEEEEEEEVSVHVRIFWTHDDMHRHTCTLTNRMIHVPALSSSSSSASFPPLLERSLPSFSAIHPPRPSIAFFGFSYAAPAGATSIRFPDCLATRRMSMA